MINILEKQNIMNTTINPHTTSKAFLSLALFLGLATGCSTIKTRQNVASLQKLSSEIPTEFKELKSAVFAENDVTTDDSVDVVTESISEATNHDITEIPPSIISEKKIRIPVELNEHVQRWIAYFTERDRERFQRFLNRGQLYRDVVENVLEENDLPAELYYLAMIESGFRTNAHSHASAVGVWQFIPGTARRYGLRIDRYVDERRDPIRATEAAAKYLRDLYNVFGSWHLAMAAYNAGEIRILRAVFKGRKRNFWDLIQSKSLPKETAEYIPKFLAVVLIGQDPKKYGFSETNNGVSYPKLEAVEVPGSLQLNQISKLSGLTLDSLKKVNPHLNFSQTPSSVARYEIWVPALSASTLKAQQSELFRNYTKIQRSTASTGIAKTSVEVHRVKPGESLLTIARKYKLSIGHLKRINNLKSNRILSGTRLRTQSRAYSPSNFVRYKVKRGENLTLIAKKFKTSITKLKVSNQLRKNQIVVGQVLKIDSPDL